MQWIRVKSEGHKHALRARQVFSQRMQRCIRVGTLETLVQVRNGENHFLDKLSRDIGFTWRFCQAPEAETGGEIFQAHCGVELAQSMLRMHQNSCKACRRVIDPTFKRKRRSDAKKPEPATYTLDVTQEEIDAVIDESESPPIQRLVDEVIAPPTALGALVAEMSRQRDRALNLAAEYDAVIAAAEGIDSETARIKEIEDQMEAHRQALLAFVAPNNTATA
jgi:hypothetical protein